MEDVDGIASDGSNIRALEGDELARRLSELADAGDVSGDEWLLIQAELARRRVETARSAPPPPGASLRSQILNFLNEAPGSTPTQISAALDRSTTVVSRVLTILFDAKLVTFTPNEDDGRVRHYHLAAADTVSADGEIASPSQVEEERQYLGLVIAAAVKARRGKNHLRYSIDRLERVLQQATASNAHDLALVARRELATTLRQDGQLDAVKAHVDVFSEIAVGAVEVERHLIAPATACLDYELGRREGLPERERLEHYVAATTMFERCKGLDGAHDWAPRQGWALLGSAELWRQQTEYGTALAQAKRAELAFVAYDDTYGSAEATRMQGFCQRLRGNFDEAIVVLKRADQLAKDSSADRSRADILLQLGDAMRCVGEFKAAAMTLAEGAELATELGRPRTVGFCYTSLGAVMHALGDLDEAWKFTTMASPLVAPSVPGRALNARRRGVIARDLAQRGAPDMLEQGLKSFHDAIDEYSEQRSPAGVAACCVGLGKFPGNNDTAIDRLVSVASSGVGRLLLPLDPWIPALVKQWADATENTDVLKVAEWTYRSDKQLKVADADEMAGEPRVKSGVLAA
ncbi:MAG: MarR family transcriptional regulator [Mycobacterium sp.]